MLYGNDLEMKKKHDFFSALPSACFKPPESQLFFVFEVPILQLFSAILPSRKLQMGQHLRAWSKLLMLLMQEGRYRS